MNPLSAYLIHESSEKKYLASSKNKNIFRSNIYLLLVSFVFLHTISCVSQQIDHDIEFYTPQQPPSIGATNIKQHQSERQDQKITFDLPKLVQFTLENNPEIKAAQYKWRAVEEKYPQVTSLPDPVLTYSHFLRNVETRVGPQNHSFSFMQMIPFPQKLYLRGEVVKDEAKIAHLAYERTVRDKVIKVQQHFYELLYIKKAQEITQKNEDLLAHYLQVAIAESTKNNAATTDVLKGQAQLAQLGYDRIRLDELEKIEEGQINALLGRNPNAKVETVNMDFLPTQQLADFDFFYKYAQKNNQEILASQIQISKANNQVSLAFSEYFPDVSVGFTWIQIDKTLSGFNFDFDDDGQDAFAITFSMNLPIWLGKNSAKVRESKLDRESAVEIQKNLENQLAADLKKVYYKITNSLRLTELYNKQLLPEAQNSIKTAENWYRDGNGNMTGILETQSVLLNFSLAFVRAQTDYAQGIAALAKLCGGNLPATPGEVAK